MAKVRILGPKERLADVLPTLQDFGRVHLSEPKESSDVHVVGPTPAADRRERELARIRGVVHAAVEATGAVDASRPGARSRRPADTPGVPAPDRTTLARWTRTARKVRREALDLRGRRARLEEERSLLARYRPFFSTFEEMAEAASNWPDVAAYFVILPLHGARSLELLREGLGEMLGDAFELWTRELESGETGVLILAPQDAETALEELVRASRLEEIELPGRQEGLSAADSIRSIVTRLDEIPTELAELARKIDELRARYGSTLQEAESSVGDELARIDALERTAETRHAFVVEGWVPVAQVPALERQLAARVGDTAVVERIDEAEWVGEDVPVVLHNPRLFRPFESLVAILPLPRYGSIDPTPFLAVFFPMFFGIVLGDIGYGLMLGILALVLHRGAEEGSTRRAVSEIAGAAAAFAVIFGIVYGELFGDLGHRAFGLEPLGMRREEALLPFLGLAIAIGVVHTLLGLVLNLLSKLRQGAKAAVGPGVTLAMVVLVVVALLAAIDVIPGGFFTPAVVVILVLFPVLVIVEGILGPTELLSTLGHILSYARVMAVGTASVMMAVAANRMVGAFGSVLVGSLFALLFHLVNFVLGVFSPTVHALRLHFVEFFGTFYSPGGTRYEPFGHWAPAAGPKLKEEQ